jgi:ABC-type Mn2+/Zn2+ transport system permease subunit
MTILRTGKYTTLLVGISLVFLFVEIQYAFDIMEHLYGNHSTYLDRALPIAWMLGAGLFVDMIVFFRRSMQETVYREQKRVYDAAMLGMNHLLRNILANFNICTSDEIKQVSRSNS